jgi:hypothetical protein
MQLEALIVPLLLDSTKYVTGLKTAGTQTASGAAGMKSQLSALGLGGVASFLSISGAIIGTVAALKAAYDETMKYGDSVRALSMLNGTSAEETSRLIQLSDDYKLSTSNLDMASRFLAKQGLSLTTEGLAQLSDQYLALNTDAEKTAFLMKNFGARGGTAFVEMMRQGGDAIRAETAAISPNLIMTQKMLDKMRELQRQTDNVEDAMTGLKLQIGMAFIPVWLKLVTAVSQAISIFDNLTEAQLQQMHGFQKFAAWYFGGGLIGSIKRHIEANRDLADTTDETTQANQDYIPTVEEVAAAEQALSDARQEQYTNVSTLAQDLTTSTDELRAAEKDLYDYTLAHPLDKKGIQDRQTAVDKLKQAQQDMVDQWLLNVMTTMLTADGEMSDADYNFLLDFQENTGQIDASGRARAESLWATARSMTAANRSIPDEVVNVTTIYTSVYGGGGSNTYGQPNMQAEGGDWMVTKPTVFIAGEAGPERATFTPMGEDATAGGGQNVTVVLEYKPMISLADRAEAERVLLPIILNGLRSQ